MPLFPYCFSVRFTSLQSYAGCINLHSSPGVADAPCKARGSLAPHRRWGQERCSSFSSCQCYSVASYLQLWVIKEWCELETGLCVELHKRAVDVSFRASISSESKRRGISFNCAIYIPILRTPEHRAVHPVF